MQGKIPNHVAIIMDGNGRWAQSHGRPRIFGHIRGSTIVRGIIRECGNLGVGYLTLYAFSSENWNRPSPEINVLMRILKKYLIRERKTLMENNVSLNAIGEVENLPLEVQKVLRESIDLTKHNSGLKLTFALSYGSRQELTNTIRALSKEVAEGRIDPLSIDEDLLSKRLQTSNMPDPDLIIRTSGEKRISNFLLWQAAYSEFYFTDKSWPEFDKEELHLAFDEYSKRTRRYGRTDAQLRERSQPL